MPEGSAVTLAGLERYANFYETLTARTLPMMRDVVSDDVHFVDPFNDVRGIEPVAQILSDMFEHIENPRFHMLDRALSAKPYSAYLKWVFSGRMRGKDFSFQGMSEIGFDINGKVIEHIDYWDSGTHVFARVPVLGYFIRAIQKRMKVKP